MFHSNIEVVRDDETFREFKRERMRENFDAGNVDVNIVWCDNKQNFLL